MTVAIVGASANRSKYGNKALRAWRRQGHSVIPIHPTAREIEGERAYASVLDYPGPIDEASIYLHADAGLRVMADLAAKRIPRVWLNPGADAPEVVARARELGLSPIVACSILGVGESPQEF